MGILNITPDSFSDGGQLNSPNSIAQKAEQMIQEGASILDIGAESSGPGSTDVSLQRELDRLLPALEIIIPIAKKHKVQISIDTYKAAVADQALQLGADIINDITGLRGDPQMATIITKHNAKVVIMYSKDDTARTTKEAKEYNNVIATISKFLTTQIAYAKDKGIKPENIILDPGMGAFISSIPSYSYEILDRLQELKQLGCPLLVGTSLKSMHPFPLEERLIPSIATALQAAQNGADILRVHQVKEHKLALNTFQN
jgi:dihydropteroate synthase